MQGRTRGAGAWLGDERQERACGNIAGTRKVGKRSPSGGHQVFDPFQLAEEREAQLVALVVGHGLIARRLRIEVKVGAELS